MSYFWFSHTVNYFLLSHFNSSLMQGTFFDEIWFLVFSCNELFSLTSGFKSSHVGIFFMKLSSFYLLTMFCKLWTSVNIIENQVKSFYGSFGRFCTYFTVKNYIFGSLLCKFNGIYVLKIDVFNVFPSLYCFNHKKLRTRIDTDNF